MMQIDRQSGLLLEARQVPSPNCDDRSLNQPIDLLVIHSISLPPGEFGGPHIDALFTNTLTPHQHPYFQEIADLKVSAHCLINRQGSVTQYVPFHKKAWHAGASRFMGREDCNNYSIGIEMEGTDDTSYTAIQYTVLATLIHTLQSVYTSLRLDRIVGHSTIAPDRKTDPGDAFDWGHLFGLLRQKLATS
jgi:AmpD protein